MWVEQGVGASEATDLALRNPEPPTGGEAYTVLLHDDFFTPTTEPPLYRDVQRRYDYFFYILFTIMLQTILKQKIVGI